MSSSHVNRSMFLLATLLYSLSVHTVSGEYISVPTLIGAFPFETAAFCSLHLNSTTSKYDLLLSGFGIFETDVAVVYDVGRKLQNIGAISPLSITRKMEWPNSIAALPDGVLETRTPFVVIPDGFFVPGREDGSVTLQPMAGGPGHIISSGQGDWFYHVVAWADMNKDGRLDALTCRAQKPILESAKGELVFFSNPKNQSLATRWKENVIASGPDVQFRLVHLKLPGASSTIEVIITAEFFNPRLRFFYTLSPTQDWSDPSLVRYRDIKIEQTTRGAPFSVEVADLNMDGRQELLVSFNDAKNGSVVVYDIPLDFRYGEFRRRTIASDYHSALSSPGTGAPGLMYVIPAEKSGEKPNILVSGDDSGRFSLLQPAQPTSSSDWTYNRIDFLHTKKSTVGGFSLADVDDDGRQEMFVTSYQEGLVYVYRL